MVLVLQLSLNSGVLAWQPARIHQGCLSLSMTTSSVELCYTIQQSSFASAEGVVSTKEYPVNDHGIGLVLWTQDYHHSLFLIKDLL
jgi:hypothetical protein